MNINSSLSKLNKNVNADLTRLCKWLRANKIALNTSKTEIILFKPKSVIITKHLNFRISGQRINLCKKVKYLGAILDEHLSWDDHISYITPKLSRACALLAKIRHFTNKSTLLNIYYALFNSHISYSNQVWGQQPSTVTKIEKLQDKAVRIINFCNPEQPVDCLYKNSGILQFSDLVKLHNCLFVKRGLAKDLPLVFDNYFTKSQHVHNHKTRASKKGLLTLPLVKTNFGKQSTKFKSATDWNNALLELRNLDFESVSFNVLKQKLKAYFGRTGEDSRFSRTLSKFAKVYVYKNYRLANSQ